MTSAQKRVPLRSYKPRYRGLQTALLLRPGQGPIVKGSGGVRKARWARAGAGKRGDLRVIDYCPQRLDVYMLYAYAQNDQGRRSQPTASGTIVSRRG